MIEIINSCVQTFEWMSHAGAGTLALTILLLLASAIMQRRRRKPRHPVAPGALPFLGHALSLSNPDEFLTVLTKWANEVGTDGIYEFSVIGKRWIVLCSDDTFMEATRLRPYKLQRASKEKSVIASLGFHGMYNAEGQQWKNDRRLVGPALNKNHIEDYFHSMKLVTNRLALKWEKEMDNVAALTDLSKYSLDIATLCFLGMDFNSLNNPECMAARDIEEVFHVTHKRILSPVPYWKIFNNLDGGRDVAERTSELVRNLIRDYRKKKEDGMQDQAPIQGKQSLLEKLIDISDGDGARLEEDRVVGNLAEMIMAGKDTTSSTLTTCLWEIAHDTELQDELYMEISNSGKDMSNLTLDDVMNGFPRLRSLLLEVLRVKGPAPLRMLEPGEAVTFKGEVLKPGTIIVALATMPGEKAASEVPTGPAGEGPENFCPRRWFVKNSKQNDLLTAIQPSNKYGGYMPFGIGVRMCPGVQMAQAEMITGLFCILGKFKFAPIENHPPIRRVSRFTLVYDGEVQLTLKLRMA